MNDITEYIQSRLFELQDKTYRDFTYKLIPTVNPETIIGVRTPALRALGREISKMPEAEDFISVLPHKYYEENNLHGFIIEQTKDFELCIERINKFLPYVDNWATCDLMSPKIFKKHPTELLLFIRQWCDDKYTYTIRFGIEMLMSFYLGDNFKPEYNNIVSCIKSNEYYVNMMIAWYFATALAKQYDATLPIIEEKKLEKWAHNKTIQKSCESYRITPAQKEYLRTLKIK